LWPDEIVACGGARPDSVPVRVLAGIERLAYRAATRICCTTRSFIETIVERGVPREKTEFIPNGADLELFRPLPTDHPILAEYPFGNRFVVMYSGLLGIKHGLEVVLEAARLLRDERNIVFFWVGSGARLEALRDRAQRMGLNNIVFGGERKVEEIPHLLARADVCLSALLSAPYLEKIITVKVFEYLACEKPVVAALAGETARVIRESGGGIVVPPNDSRAMADAVLSLYRDPQRRAAMGRRGRTYVEENFSRAIWATRLERMLREICAGVQKKNTLSRASETNYVEEPIQS
jgi:glycosyltransferase involved in cell wall biosynthesis